MYEICQSSGTFRGKTIQQRNNYLMFFLLPFQLSACESSALVILYSKTLKYIIKINIYMHTLKS